MTKSFKITLAMICLALMAGSLMYAQSIFATLTGVVSDPAAAVVPNAKVTLRNSASGDIRNSVTNAEGYFTFSAVPVGTYEVSVDAPGFLKYEVSGVSFTGAEKRNLDIALKIGSTSEKVEVTSIADVLVPVDSGEKSATLTTKQLQDFSVVGRSAAEFIKILPGFGIANTGTENRQNFTGETIGINGNGDGGSQSAFNGAYSVNGLPNNSLDITADGAHVSDPGCNCATPVNPNTDMIQEFKVLTSNFGAENQKGPANVNTIAKAGGRDFHGGAYFYMRDYHMNSNDWVNNRFGTPRPENRYMFPGGNIGGPVIFPRSNFNKNRDKLFFFTGFEYYFQRLDTGLVTATVPTADMRNGNFSPAELTKLGNITAGGGPPSQVDQSIYPGGIIPPSQIDPTGKMLTNLIDLPNADPNSNGGYNYVKQIVFDQNSWQWMTRVDYSFSDNTKLFVRYNMQRERQVFPIGLWWRNGAVQLPYPTPVIGQNKSDSWSASLTHVFNPTLTNEFVFGYTFIGFPNVFEDPTKVDRFTLTQPTSAAFTGLWKNGVAQIPSFTAWGGEFATMLNPGGFEVGGSRGLYADKWLPSFSDNISKVWGTHTAKFGGFYEWIRNSQPDSPNTNGQLTFHSGWGGNTSGNPYADMLTGRINGYNETSLARLNDEAYTTFEFFAQDSWKVNRKLTLEYGIRTSYFGPWYDRLNYGFAVFDYSKYNPAAPPTQYSGFDWHGQNPAIRNSGYPANNMMFWAPRFGFAYDLMGTGNTVLRGGWGRFYYHSGQATTGLAISGGEKTYNFGNTTFNDIMATDPGAGQRLGAAAVDQYDNKSPYSDSYSFTIAQRTPWSGLAEFSYVGNTSKNLLNSEWWREHQQHQSSTCRRAAGAWTW